MIFKMKMEILINQEIKESLTIMGSVCGNCPDGAGKPPKPPVK